MHIIKPYDRPVPEDGGCAMALGCFDGVHIGHLKLLRHTAESACRLGYTPAVFTFPGSDDAKTGPRLFSDEENMRRISMSGIRRVYAVPFSSVRDLSPRQFVLEVLSKEYNVRLAVCGENFRFGADAAGDAAALAALTEECGADTEIIGSVMSEGEVVSSTAVRQAVLQGDIERANRMLAQPYSLSGVVKNGKGLGRKLGIPTANIDLSPSLIIPKCGVYASVLEAGGSRYPSITNIGMRPTFEVSATPNCETHIIGYGGVLYGSSVSVSLLGYLRPERKFSTAKELEAQISRDIEQAQRYR